MSYYKYLFYIIACHWEESIYVYNVIIIYIILRENKLFIYHIRIIILWKYVVKMYSHPKFFCQIYAEYLIYNVSATSLLTIYITEYN